ncbi:hypothetical protein IC744_14020 [Microbacterium hominis]|uniref:hypothetical protein n=1 Tax=Microbacterium TaxID=33882 RepID=UPI00168B6395|nr:MULTISPECIES: hypothetical protein [Microbacterium]QOC24397.1 hypothetical protein IC745_08260 [Microbacterium hominis]QOC28475.1 hypothetical protein IC744_14020 [Microbacterium hominis]QYF96322.1 hypothetical protein KY498_08885 [Microbacterium sp. PAMC21962]
MVEIANAAFFPAGTITIGTDSYKSAILSATLTPTTPTEVLRDIGGGITTVAGTPEWALGLNLAQDLKTANSLSQYLIANAGTKKTIVYTPQTGGKGFTVTALILPAAVGGAGGAAAKSDVTLPCDGQPTIA